MAALAAGLAAEGLSSLAALVLETSAFKVSALVLSTTTFCVSIVASFAGWTGAASTGSGSSISGVSNTPDGLFSLARYAIRKEMPALALLGDSWGAGACFDGRHCLRSSRRDCRKVREESCSTPDFDGAEAVFVGACSKISSR